MIPDAPTAAITALLLLLSATPDHTHGFVSTRRQHRQSDRPRPATASSSRDEPLDVGPAQLSPAMSDHISRGNSALHSLTVRPDGPLGRLKARGTARRSRNMYGTLPEQQETATEEEQDMATQLGGWSCAKTVWSSGRKTSSGNKGGSDASRSRRTSRSDAGRSPSSSAGNPEENSSKAGTGSSRKKLDGDEAASSRRGTASGGGGGGDGGGGKGGDDSDDDDNADQAWEAGAEAAESWEAQGLNDEDDWDLDSLSDVEEYDLVDDDDAGRLATEKPDEATTAPSASATGAAGRDARDDSAASIPTGTAQEYEVVCDGDVCERKPVGPKLAQTVAASIAGPSSDDAPVVDDAADSMSGARAGAVAADSTAPDGNAAPPADENDTESAVGATATSGEAEKAGGGPTDGGDDPSDEEDDPAVDQLVEMGWEKPEAVAALKEAGGDMLTAAEALAEAEEKREEEFERDLSAQFEESVDEMVEHGWDEQVARKALLMQWEKDIDQNGGGRQTYKNVERIVKGSDAVEEEAKKPEPPKSAPAAAPKKAEPPAPTPAKSEDVVFEVTDKTLQKVVIESPVPVILDLYAEWCGPCKQLTPALEEAAIRSGGMFRVAKVDAEKQRGIAEVLGIKAFPSIFGVKDGIILDNFVGILPQDEMQSFMMGVIMGVPPNKDKELREHQKGQAELRGMSRKLAHVAGLAVLGSRKKENLCLKVDKALGTMLPSAGDETAVTEDAAVVGAAKKAARTVITILMSAYKHPEDPKYRKLSTASKVFEDVLSKHPPILEVLRLAGFRHENENDSHLTLLHRNMAVLASVQDRVEVWNKSIKMPQVEEYDRESESEDGDDEGTGAAGSSHATSMAKLEISNGDSSGGMVRMELSADSTLGELFQALQADEGHGDDLVLTSPFPKRQLAAADSSCHSSTLASLGLAPSARLVATDAKTLAAEKEEKGGGEEQKAKRKQELRARMMEKSQDKSRKGTKKAGTLFGAADGIIEVKKGKHQEYFGGDSTVTLAAADEEEGVPSEDNADREDDFGEDEDDIAGDGTIAVKNADDEAEPEQSFEEDSTEFYEELDTGASGGSPAATEGMHSGVEEEEYDDEYSDEADVDNRLLGQQQRSDGREQDFEDYSDEISSDGEDVLEDGGYVANDQASLDREGSFDEEEYSEGSLEEEGPLDGGNFSEGDDSFEEMTLRNDEMLRKGDRRDNLNSGRGGSFRREDEGADSYDEEYSDDYYDSYDDDESEERATDARRGRGNGKPRR